MIPSMLRRRAARVLLRCRRALPQAYLWSTIAARDLGIISPREARKRMAKTLATTAGLERGPGGQFFNWYDPDTGERG